MRWPSTIVPRHPVMTRLSTYALVRILPSEYDPLGKVQNQIVHNLLRIFYINLHIARISFAASITHQMPA